MSQASQQASASQTAAVTATQAALAIVGSIIASTLITILIYFLIIRHKQTAKGRSRNQRSPEPGPRASPYSRDPKFPISEQVGTTIAASQFNYNETEHDPVTGSHATFSQFQKEMAGEKSADLRQSITKTTSVVWDPTRPPRAPTLGSWLKYQGGVSPFGPINLPTDIKTPSPLGGQLKSPLRSIPTSDPTAQPEHDSHLTSAMPAHTRSPDFPSYGGSKSTITVVPATHNMIPVPHNLPKKKDVAGSSPARNPVAAAQYYLPAQAYRESKASIWTDDVAISSPSPPLQSPPPELRNEKVKPRAAMGSASVTGGYSMRVSPPENPVRNTAEWLAAREGQKAHEESRNSSKYRYQSRTSDQPSYTNVNNRSNSGLPQNPRTGSGLPRKSGLSRHATSMEAEVGYVEGLSRFLGDGVDNIGLGESGLSRSDTPDNNSNGLSSRVSTGVGKAL